MADYVRDAMHTALFATYALTYTADMENQFWVDEGHAPSGPGDRMTFFKAAGAAGDSLGDAELDYWLNVYGGGATFYILMENNDRFLTEDGANLLRKE